MKLILTKNGGEIGAAGTVAWMFDLVGLTEVPIEGGNGDKARQILKLIELLEEDDDVTNVYSNFEIADSIAEEV